MNATVTATAPLTFSDARRQANSFTKALSMRKDGYRAQQYGKTPVYAIFKPENTAKTNGYADYDVNLTPGKIACNCTDFEKHGKFCKHTLFAEMEQKRQREEAAEDAHFEAMAAKWAEEQDDARFVLECAIDHSIRF